MPDSVDYCKASGFDIVRWMEEDLIDLLVVSGYFRLNPWKQTFDLAHKYGIPVYPALSDVRRLDNESSIIRSSVECMRGRAAQALNAGADGIYIFNFWDTSSAIWNEIGEQRTLATASKVYTTGARAQDSTDRFLTNGSRFINRVTISPATPKKLEPGKSTSIELNVAEDSKEAMRRGASSDYKLMLRFNKLPGPQDISLELNKKSLPDGSKAGEWLKELIPIATITPPSEDLESSVWMEYSVKPELLKKGANSIAIKLNSDDETELALEDIVLRSRYYRSDGRGGWKERIVTTKDVLLLKSKKLKR